MCLFYLKLISNSPKQKHVLNILLDPIHPPDSFLSLSKEFPSTLVSYIYNSQSVSQTARQTDMPGFIYRRKHDICLSHYGLFHWTWIIFTSSITLKMTFFFFLVFMAGQKRSARLQVLEETFPGDVCLEAVSVWKQSNWEWSWDCGSSSKMSMISSVKQSIFKTHYHWSDRG